MKRLAIMASALVAAGCSDTVTERYATIEDARKAGMFERGWLPDALPSSTWNIEARNDLDLNVSAGSFALSLSDLDSFSARLRPYSAGVVDADAHLASYLQAQAQRGLRVGVFEQTSSVWIFVCDPKIAQCIYQLVPER